MLSNKLYSRKFLVINIIINSTKLIAFKSLTKVMYLVKESMSKTIPYTSKPIEKKSSKKILNLKQYSCFDI